MINRNSKFLSFIIFSLCSFFAFGQADLNIIGKADSPVYTVSWSPDGSLFATSGDNFVLLWYADTNTTKTFYVEHGVPVVSSRFSNDSKWFLSVGADSSIIVRSLDNQTAPTKISSNTDQQIKDAAFLTDNGFSVAVPVDGRNLTCFFRLMASQEFVQRKITEVFSTIYSIDVNKNGTRILLGTEDGKAIVLDATTGELVQELPRFADSKIKPRFSPDGRKFIAATDAANLVISYTNTIGSKIIRDGDMFANAVAWSPDSSKIACATKAGSVKIFDAETCKNEDAFFLVDGNDEVVSLTYSPDGEFLLAGTRKGYIYRWSLTGKVFDPQAHKYVDKNSPQAQAAMQNPGEVPDVGELISAIKGAVEAAGGSQSSGADSGTGAGAGSGGSGAGQSQKNGRDKATKLDDSRYDSLYKYGHSIIVDFGASTPPSPYDLELSLAAGYLNYNVIRPFYFGAFLKPSFAFPIGSFPYEYTLNGATLSSPKLVALKIYAPLGFVIYPFYDDVEVFGDLSAGLSISKLWNVKFGANSVASKAYYSFYGAVRVGAGWRFMRFSVAGEYDTVFGFTFCGSAGFNIKIHD